MAKYSTHDKDKVSAIAEAIRKKTKYTDTMLPREFADVLKAWLETPEQYVFELENQYLDNSPVDTEVQLSLNVDDDWDMEFEFEYSLGEMYHVDNGIVPFSDYYTGGGVIGATPDRGVCFEQVAYQRGDLSRAMHLYAYGLHMLAIPAQYVDGKLTCLLSKRIVDGKIKMTVDATFYSKTKRFIVQSDSWETSMSVEWGDSDTQTYHFEKETTITSGKNTSNTLVVGGGYYNNKPNSNRFCKFQCNYFRIKYV